MGKTAAAKFSRIQRAFKQKSYEKVISECRAFLHSYDVECNYEVWIYLARSHFHLHQFAQGTSAIEEAKNISRKQNDPRQ